MINFHFGDIYSSVLLLARHMQVALDEEPTAVVSKADMFGANLALERAETASNKLGLIPPLDWIWRARAAIQRGQLTNAALACKLEIVLQSLESEAGREHFFHYPRAKAELYMRATHDWAPVIGAFNGSEYDILQGVDCYACAHETASVFHFMNVCERGLRALAIERKIWKSKRPIERVDWSTLAEQLFKHVDRETPHIKDARRQEYREFYKGALGHLDGIKHWLRHPMAHGRLRADEPQARSVMESVRGFMIRVSSRTDENGRRIRWS